MKLLGTRARTASPKTDVDFQVSRQNTYGDLAGEQRLVAERAAQGSGRSVMLVLHEGLDFRDFGKRAKGANERCCILWRRRGD